MQPCWALEKKKSYQLNFWMLEKCFKQLYVCIQYYFVDIYTWNVCTGFIKNYNMINIIQTTFCLKKVKQYLLKEKDSY